MRKLLSNIEIIFCYNLNIGENEVVYPFKKIFAHWFIVYAAFLSKEKIICVFCTPYVLSF